MSWIALKMLFGDRAKYAGLIFGVAFSALLISQQSAFCVGLINTTPGLLYDIREPDLWVMDARVNTIDGGASLPDTALARVHGVPGIAWAAPLFKGVVTLIGQDQSQQTASLIGVDDSTLLGLPRERLLGSADDLRRSGAIFIDEAGYRLLWPGEPLRIGRVLELNDRRAVLVGVLRSSPQFTSSIAIFTQYRNAVQFAPGGRNRLSFLLARTRSGSDVRAVAASVSQRTGLKALTHDEFIRSTIDFFIRTTPIPASFGFVVVLGVIVGVVIIGLTFSLFIRDHLPQFAAMKAIGVSNATIIGMVLLQGLLVGFIGYAFGVGLTAFTLDLGRQYIPDFRSFFLPWPIVIGTAVIEVFMVIAAGLIALHRVLVADPAMVFRP